MTNKNNKSILLCSLFISLLALATITGCSKSDDSDDTNTVADSYVGIWNAKDTTYLFSGGISKRTFNFSIAKKDANNVYLINFVAGDTGVFTVSSTALVYSSGGSGSGASFLAGLVMTRSGDKIFYSAPTGSANINTGVATKQ